jgi:hypothetical protein
MYRGNADFPTERFRPVQQYGPAAHPPVNGYAYLPPAVYPQGYQPQVQVTKTRRETRHGLHITLSVCTFGVWAFTGWPLCWAINRFGPRQRTVTRSR